MREEFSQNFEGNIWKMKETFNECMEDIKKEYDKLQTNFEEI